MILHTPTSVVFIGSEMPLAGTLDAWMHTHLAEPLNVASVTTVPDALVYLRSHRVDLILVDEATARAELRTIHVASPTTAIIGLVMKMDESVQLLMLRQGVHEVLCLLPSTDADHARTIERALARVNGRAGLLKAGEPCPDIAAAPPRLIHDLNNLLTSINGFADLLLAQLPTDNPARMGAEQIRLAGKRAATLLKAQSPGHSGLPAASSPIAPSITAKAA
jgi:signal transduction histidine kinase